MLSAVLLKISLVIVICRLENTCLRSVGKALGWIVQCEARRGFYRECVESFVIRLRKHIELGIYL